MSYLASILTVQNTKAAEASLKSFDDLIEYPYFIDNADSKIYIKVKQQHAFINQSLVETLLKVEQWKIRKSLVTNLASTEPYKSMQQVWAPKVPTLTARLQALPVEKDLSTSLVFSRSQSVIQESAIQESSSGVDESAEFMNKIMDELVITKEASLAEIGQFVLMESRKNLKLVGYWNANQHLVEQAIKLRDSVKKWEEEEKEAPRKGKTEAKVEKKRRSREQKEEAKTESEAEPELEEEDKEEPPEPPKNAKRKATPRSKTPTKSPKKMPQWLTKIHNKHKDSPRLYKSTTFGEDNPWFKNNQQLLTAFKNQLQSSGVAWQGRFDLVNPIKMVWDYYKGDLEEDGVPGSLCEAIESLKLDPVAMLEAALKTVQGKR